MDRPQASVRVEFGILGSIRLAVAGEERLVAGEKVQALLARLLVEPNRPVATERLIDDLWGDDPPATARESLHVHVARLRRLLASDGAEGSRLAKSERGYLLHVHPGELDETQFRVLLDSARRERDGARLAAAAAAYREALALWRGTALEGIGTAWADAERGRLEELRVATVEERIDVDLQLGGAAELLPELESLVADHPFRERLRAQLMRALYASGRQAEALAAYQQARRDLDRVGLAPGPRLRELESAILRQDPELATSPLAGPPARAVRAIWSGRLLAAGFSAVAVLVIAAVALATRDDPPRAAPAPAVEVRPDSLVEIDPLTNRVVSTVRVGKDPGHIGATRGALWVANTGDRTVSRIDLRSRRVRTVGGAPVVLALAATLDGVVWVSSFEEPYVALIAAGGEVLEGGHVVASGPERVRLPGSAEGLAVGGGYLWVTSPRDSGGGDTVSLVDLRSRELVRSIAVGSVPIFVTFGYGSGWVANYRGNSVSVVRPGRPEAETIEVAGGPLGIAAGSGAVWVVTFWPQELVRIDPERLRVVTRIPVGAGPFDVAAGAGAVWVTNRDDRTVSRIDPATNRVTATIRLGASPHAIRFAQGRVWVTTQRCGSPVAHC